jgi:ATP-binding cassette subfamily B protein
VIIISHRFSTVRNADRIIVFEKGKVVEHGSHEELMDLNGRYAKAFRIQAEGYR